MNLIRHVRPSFVEEEILKLLSSVEQGLPEATMMLLSGSRARGESGYP